MFGRRRRRAAADPGGTPLEDRAGDPDEDPAEGPGGPYDATEAPPDGRPRLDLGSVRLPVPEGAQLQVEVDRAGPVRAVHLRTAAGQLTVTAFAAPRSGGLWREVATELTARLRGEGARVTRTEGEWGQEVEAVQPGGTVLRFLAVEGPRWMLRGVAAGPAETAPALAGLLRDVVRDTVVVRGAEALPVRSPLALALPAPLAEQLKEAAARARAAGPDGAAG